MEHLKVIRIKIIPDEGETKIEKLKFLKLFLLQEKQYFDELIEKIGGHYNLFNLNSLENVNKEIGLTISDALVCLFMVFMEKEHSILLCLRDLILQRGLIFNDYVTEIAKTFLPKFTNLKNYRRITTTLLADLYLRDLNWRDQTTYEKSSFDTAKYFGISTPKSRRNTLRDYGDPLILLNKNRYTGHIYINDGRSFQEIEEQNDLGFLGIRKSLEEILYRNPSNFADKMLSGVFKIAADKKIYIRSYPLGPMGKFLNKCGITWVNDDSLDTNKSISIENIKTEFPNCGALKYLSIINIMTPTKISSYISKKKRFEKSISIKKNSETSIKEDRRDTIELSKEKHRKKEGGASCNNYFNKYKKYKKKYVTLKMNSFLGK
jgi:hypothetical protein